MSDAPASPAVVVGGVGELWQGDLDLGRLAAERLAGEDLGPDVAVEEFGYGALAVAWRLEELRPETLVLVGAIARGRPPGEVERREVERPRLTDAEAQAAMGEALTGYVNLDLLVEVVATLGALPERTVAIEVEPATVAPSDRLSPEAEAALERALELVRAEVARYASSSRPSA